MKRLLMALAIAFAWFPSPAAAAPIYFTGSLSGPAEEPPNGSPGTGFTTVTIDPVAHTLRVEVSFSGLLGTTTASHIHIINSLGDANTLDTVGPVATTTPTFLNFPLGVTAGTYDATFDTLTASTYRPGLLTLVGGSLPAAEQELFNGIIQGRAYLNIHSSVFGGGEIRSFLQPVRVAPEPATLALIGMGAVAVLRRRCRR
jgi:hypothetical protein